MAISTYEGLNARARELAILAVGAHFNCAYELYAHKSIAGLLGFSGPQIVDMSEGRQRIIFLEKRPDIQRVDFIVYKE
ncbi:Carboxymuconolactone decarboxylase-like protein [Rutstroemia sp. NJR-2017a WRK4]|nr:Carboxymuconolactone decarboxylase-like protein [Rutstroemia sp. NJR-2017a WRK4]